MTSPLRLSAIPAPTIVGRWRAAGNCRVAVWHSSFKRDVPARAAMASIFRRNETFELFEPIQDEYELPPVVCQNSADAKQHLAGWRLPEARIEHKSRA